MMNLREELGTITQVIWGMQGLTVTEMEIIRADAVSGYHNTGIKRQAMYFLVLPCPS